MITQMIIRIRAIESACGGASPEKTVADCFKYRNKIGLDTAREALKFYLERRKRNLDSLLQAAEVSGSPG
jgi:hypothetical protein